MVVVLVIRMASGSDNAQAAQGSPCKPQSLKDLPTDLEAAELRRSVLTVDQNILA